MSGEIEQSHFEGGPRAGLIRRELVHSLLELVRLLEFNPRQRAGEGLERIHDRVDVLPRDLGRGRAPMPYTSPRMDGEEHDLRDAQGHEPGERPV